MRAARTVGNVFISYRRDDTLGDARQLKQWLSDRFGASQVFLDESSIETGEEWAQRIEGRLNDATAVLVLIGPTWKEHLEKRLAQPEKTDWVRLELTRAIDRRTKGDLRLLMPLLLGNARPPSADGLALELSSLLEQLGQLQCSSYRVSDPVDMEKLEIDLVLRGGLRKEAQGQECLDRCGQQLKAELNKATLADFKGQWEGPPLSPRLSDNTFDSFQDFLMALERTPRPSVAEKGERRDALRRVLGLLLLMCADYGRLCIWSDKYSPMAWTADSAGMAASLKAGVLGQPIMPKIQRAVNPDVEHIHVIKVSPEGLQELDEAIKSQKRSELAQSILKEHAATSTDASLTGEARTERHLTYAKRAVKQGSRRNPHFLAEQVNLGNEASELVRSLAQEFDMPLVPFVIGEQSLFRHMDNETVYLEFKDALDAIATHTA